MKTHAKQHSYAHNHGRKTHVLEYTRHFVAGKEKFIRNPLHKFTCTLVCRTHTTPIPHQMLTLPTSHSCFCTCNHKHTPTLQSKHTHTHPSIHSFLAKVKVKDPCKHKMKSLLIERLFLPWLIQIAHHIRELMARYHIAGVCFIGAQLIACTWNAPQKVNGIFRWMAFCIERKLIDGRKHS